MDITAKVRGIIAETILPGAKKKVESFKDDESLAAAGIIDSIGLLVLVTAVEKEFKIKVPPEEYALNTFDSVQAIAQYAERRTKTGK